MVKKIIILFVILFLILQVLPIVSSQSNSSPTISNPQPPDGATNISLTLSQLSVEISDPNGDLMDWTIETSPNIGNASGTDATNGTIICPVSGLSPETVYTWYVNVTDGNSWTNESFTFTTVGLPVVTTNEPTGVEETNATLHGYLQDDGGEPCTVGFEWGTTTDCGNRVVVAGEIEKDEASTWEIVPGSDEVNIGSWSNMEDQNWDTYGGYSVSVGSAEGGIVEQYNLLWSIPDIVKYTYKYGMYLPSSGDSAYVKVYFYNFTSSSYELIANHEFSNTGYVHIGFTKTETVNLPSSALSPEDIVKIKISLHVQSSQPLTSAYVRFYEGKISYKSKVTSPFEFSYDLSNLSPGTLYYYRAFAENSAGTVYGETLLVDLVRPNSSIATMAYW